MKQSILDAIKKYEKIIIHRHIRPDPDAYGSQGGLAEIIKASFPEKQVYTVGKEEVSLNFLRRLDVIEDQEYKDALVIVCDTANQDRICDKRYFNGAMLIKIDHHPNDDVYGDIVWVDTNASSVSEMIYEFYLFGKDQGLKLSDEAAKLIYAGIVGDTGRFLYPSTTEKAFEYAGELINYNFSRTAVYDQLYELEPHVVKLKGFVLQNFVTAESNVAYMKLTKEILGQFGATAAQASMLVGELGNVKGIKAWVFFIEEEDQIRVRLRSKGPIINVVAKKYNGGGHPLASGASITDWSTVEAIVTDLVKVCQQ
ncbi:DHH family phosphoesterase [Niallia nealsonii]|uniref:DHH family phosphoesterase n=1 Tax=Niallia nealsonii TaxID=115979 RepID=A0A2N0Z666_9BACI|nr:bifunctional oligoribonuclease/PAP phosphatase NrnA [Niallia nealsonii]PKG24990.1 DHH family phosphoesterase [Niallia nealsonii]